MPRIPLGVSITCVLLSYPVAYMLALVAGRRKYTLLLIIIAPFLTSYLLRVLAWRDLSVRYKQTVIGVLWALIRPLLTMLVFTIIFGQIARLPADGTAPYPLMVFAGRSKSDSRKAKPARIRFAFGSISQSNS